NREFGRVITVVKAAEMLDFVDTPKQLVVLEPTGQRFVRANPDERKLIWREQLLKLRLFREIYELLQRQPEHEIDREFLLETFILKMPQENYERIFNTFIRWARFGDLFAFDETTETISLQ
ncbi:MAG TPA: AAA-associated domain-containing protein, partial [Gemmataceae bacterium]|nr:AAA-associated domain-containing protein [Gemmataceae bacterium]